MSFGKRRNKSRIQWKPGDFKNGDADRFPRQQGHWFWYDWACFLVTAAYMAAIVHGLGPALAIRVGERPERELRVKVEGFQRFDPIKTNARNQEAEDKVAPVLDNNPEKLRELRKKFGDLLENIAKNTNHETVNAESGNYWNLDEKRFLDLRQAMDTDSRREDLKRRLDQAFQPLLDQGILGPNVLPATEETAPEFLIRNPQNANNERIRVSRDSVLPERMTNADNKAALQFEQVFRTPELGRGIFSLLRDKLAGTPTLMYNSEETQKARNLARAAVENAYDEYHRGDLLVPAGQVVSEEEWMLLNLEHQEYLKGLTARDLVRSAAAVFVLVSAMFGLLMVMIRITHPKLAGDFRRKLALYGLLALTMTLVRLLAWEQHDAEVIPLAVAGMVLAIAHSPQLALPVTLLLVTLSTLAQGLGTDYLILVSGGIAAGVLTLDQVRSRTKLIRVGAIIGATFAVLTFAFGLWRNQPFTLIFSDAFVHFFGGLISGFLLGGSLPLIEKYTGIVTGISLLELGDQTHPLLLEMVQRAPGTYNHSMTVAIIAEAAAKAVDANALLVRVGAYFHDIGKMSKPQYFIENQGSQANRHSNLAPAMSTLIIIGHVKDGVELARQHGLSQKIVDFIAQHHGTTLVEYFFREAAKRGEDNTPLLESAFRYPGPKPQSKETAILMICDACESASRTLSEPNSGRIAGLVEDILKKRLNDHQFDECGLTFSELAVIRDSIIKSLIAIYHGRVRYPEQRIA